MKRISTLLILIFICQAVCAQVWTKKAAVYTGNGGRGTTSFSIPSANGGYAVGCAPHVFENWKYDKPTDSWISCKAYPGSGDGTQVGFSINGIGYMGTGVDNSCNRYNTFFSYDPVADTWTQLPNVPGSVRGYAIGFAIGEIGYIGGGNTACTGVGLHDFYGYNPVVNKWDTLAPCPARGTGSNAIGFSIGNYGYVGTGDSLGAGGAGISMQDFWQYDPSLDKWTRKADFPGGPRNSATFFSTCNLGFVGLGISGPNHSIYNNDFYQYDPDKDKWSQISNFGGSSRASAPAFVIGKSYFVGLGYDNSATQTDIWEFTFAPAFSAINTICTGTPVTFTDTSNYAPTNWQWSFPYATPNTSTEQNPTITYDSAGTYSVTLTAWNGCDSGTYTASNYITVGNGGTLSALATPTVVCSGSVANLAVVNPSGSNYTWSPSTGLTDSTGSAVMATPLVTTTYTITQPGGGGCASTGTVVVNVGSTASGGYVTTQRDTICSGTPGTLFLSGNSKDTIRWQSSVDTTDFIDVANQTAGDSIQYRTLPLTVSTFFRVLVNNGSCSAYSTIQKLIVPPSLTATFSYTLVSKTATFNADSSKGNISSYYWDFGDGQNSLERSPIHTYTADTTVSACLTIYDGSNCSYTFCRSIVFTGVKEINAEGNFNIYPSPFGNELNIDIKKLTGPVQTINMYDVLGRVVISEVPGNNNSTFSLNTSSLAKGMYYVQIKTAAASYIEKVVKQ